MPDELENAVKTQHIHWYSFLSLFFVSPFLILFLLFIPLFLSLCFFFFKLFLLLSIPQNILKLLLLTVLLTVIIISFLFLSLAFLILVRLVLYLCFLSYFYYYWFFRDHLKKYVVEFPNTIFMLFHFSQRYRDEEIAAFFQKEVDGGIKNLYWWPPVQQ